MGAPYHGVDGLIYLSGIEISGANAWSINITPDLVETGKFGDDWKGQLKGLQGWNGNITAYDMGDEDTINDVAIASNDVILLIYPDRATLTRYHYGSVFLGSSGDGGTTAAVMMNGDFTGNGALQPFGWA